MFSVTESLHPEGPRPGSLHLGLVFPRDVEGHATRKEDGTSPSQEPQALLLHSRLSLGTLCFPFSFRTLLLWVSPRPAVQSSFMFLVKAAIALAGLSPVLYLLCFLGTTYPGDTSHPGPPPVSASCLRYTSHPVLASSLRCTSHPVSASCLRQLCKLRDGLGPLQFSRHVKQNPEGGQQSGGTGRTHEQVKSEGQ